MIHRAWKSVINKFIKEKQLKEKHKANTKNVNQRTGH